MQLYADSARGVYIPQFFATTVKRDCVEGVSQEDWDILEAGPTHLHYWDVWNDVLDNAILTDPTNGKVMRLWQDGDLWLIEDGEEIPEV